MHENLVIVESPAKAKTIEKFLGEHFTVRSSYGHVRDLVKKDLGVDIENGFRPTYEVPADKNRVVSELAKLAKGAKTVWLASDEDREGEAIAWHLTQVLGLPVESTKRIVFHEITKPAILKAIESPRTVDMNLVNAQQARRILDRIVGFELSPVLWRKVRPSLSAGRVQSVAVRLLVEREREIIEFNSTPYFRVTAQFISPEAGKKVLFKADLNKRFETKQEAMEFLDACCGAEFTVRSAESKPATKSPAAPFTTSTLQQESARKLGMSVSQTMSTAQKLYENGFITYMRTDSVHLSAQAIAAAKDEITSLFGSEYSNPRNFTTKSKGAQEAHEAIRPSYLNKQDVAGTPAEKRLYDLIWKRTVASQMSPAKIERTVVNIDVSGRKEHFTATGEVILFDGFLKLYIESTDDESEETGEGLLPKMSKGDNLESETIMATERFLQAPPRYGEASLVKRLEELGIGRPSTYAPTISTIINRGYVVKQNREGVKREYVSIALSGGKIVEKVLSENTGKEKNKLTPTDIGMLVNDYLERQFGGIVDYNFTAGVEKQFDDVADGKVSWEEVIGRFYRDFHPTVAEALEATHVNTSQSRELGLDPATGRMVSARIGRFGPMVQIESEVEGEKPRYAGLKKGQLIASITLEDALELFALPRTLGQIEDLDAVVGIGRFGPYIRHDGKFTSLPKSEDPYTVTLERAIEIIEQKRVSDLKKKTPIKVFEAEEIQVLNGRYGPYITCKGSNFKIPKDKEPESLTLEECLAIIEGAAKKESPKRAAPKKRK